MKKLIKKSIRFIIRLLLAITIILSPFYLLALIEKYTILQIFLYVIVVILLVKETKNIIKGE